MQKIKLFKIDRQSIDLMKNNFGHFVVYDSDYEFLKNISSEEKVVSVSYDGPLQFINSMPECHLEICLGTESISALAETIHTLDPQLVSFKIELKTEPVKVMELLEFLTPFQFSIDIVEMIGRHSKENLFKYLHRYLFESKNKALIEPFHSILNSFITSSEINIWRWSWFGLNNFYLISNGSIVYLDRDGSYIPVGSVENGSIKKRAEFLAIEKRRIQAYTDNEKCKSCSYYFACSGFSEVILGQCDEWFELFDQLHDVSLELKQVLNSEKNID